MVRKFVGLAVLVAVASMMLAGAAFAEEKIAVLEPQKVLFGHPKFKAVQEQIQASVTKKQEEAKLAIEKETDNKKKAEIYQKKREEAAAEEQSLMKPLFDDIDKAIRTVAANKKFSLVLDKSAAFFGGVDITTDVIQALKK